MTILRDNIFYRWIKSGKISPKFAKKHYPQSNPLFSISISYFILFTQGESFSFLTELHRKYLCISVFPWHVFNKLQTVCKIGHQTKSKFALY